MSQNEIEELKLIVEKIAKINEYGFRIIENEIKMLKYELCNGLIKTNHMTEIKCRMCAENKKEVKGTKQEIKKICSDCVNNMIDEFESDNDIC